MTPHVRRARSRTGEMLVDEMPAICAGTETRRERKESQEAQAGYAALLYDQRREQDDEEE